MPESGDTAAPAPANDPVVVHLQHARGRHARWVLLGGVLGVLCILNLGTLGKGVGFGLVLVSVWSAYHLLRTFLFSPGDIVLARDRVSLPRGLCQGAAVELPRSAVTTAYFLRRAVPWNRAAPVLVIEADGRAFLYPRDWFASEADQRRVVEAAVGDAPT